MYFGITEKLTTDCISPYSNAGLISKVSDKIASDGSENTKKVKTAVVDNHTVV